MSVDENKVFNLVSELVLEIRDLRRGINQLTTEKQQLQRKIDKLEVVRE